ncbi:kinetochore protein Nuf2-like [Lampris incognitus]|uniref:kinetochore protein Nuf2-like n=1 Tax=Lampris incognitus TaxID=2546036 RepID=UPI0024B5EF6E|nr:kinetochore protein Nuf2-like [Lampris incognitus]
MTANTFPIFKVDEIVNFYRNEVLTGQEAKHFTRNDLTPTPKPLSVQSLYMKILHLVYRFRPECHFMVPVVENIQCPQFHESSAAIISVYVRMQQFLPLCFVYDFSLNDLLAPKLKRTLTILSGIMNFIHFRKQKREITLATLARFKADTDKLQDISKGINALEQKIETLTTIPPEQKAETLELDADLSELKTAIVSEYQQVNGINDVNAEVKTTIAERTQKLAQLKLDLSNSKEELSKLKSQIVESPEELKSQMEKMRANVKSIKSSIKHCDERMVELQNTIQSVSHYEADVHLMSKLLQDLQSGLSSTKQQQEEVQELTGLYEKQKKELKNLGTEEVQIKRALAMKLGKESKQQIRRQKKKEMMAQRVNDVLRQHDQIHQKREEMVERNQEITRETQQLKAKIQCLRDTCSKETEKAQALYDNLSASLDALHRRIERHFLDKTSATF